MLMVNGTYQRIVREDIRLQIYRDDNGAHLTVMLPAESRSIEIELPDSECKRLAHALDSIAEEPPF